MTTVWKPRPWQHQMVDHLLAHERCALWADLGMGKTSTTLIALDALKTAGAMDKALILGPLRVARDVWPDEVNRWAQLADFTVQPITGTADERCAALRNDKADAYAINYDNIPWLVDKLGAAWPFDTVVADEARKLKGHRLRQGGARTKALASVAFSKVRRWYNLTGRPAPNGLGDLWGQTWFLDQGFRLGRSFDAFQNRWFGFLRAQDAVRSHQTFVQRVVFPHSQAEIQAALSDICLTVDPKDWFKVDEPVHRIVKVKLPSSARKHYAEMEKEMFTELEGIEIESFGGAAKTMRCIQLTGGALYLDDTGTRWGETHNEKIEALRSILSEAAGSVLVAYHFKHELARLKEAFPEGVDLATNEGMDQFKAGAAPLGFGHPASMGHGVDGLQHVCNTAVFYTSWWDLDQRDQLIGRIGPTRQHQAGYDRPVFIYSIIAEDTIDELVLERLETKRSVQDILLEALKRRKGQL